MIEDAEADAIIRDIKGLLRSFKIKTYDEDTGYGLLRHVLIRKGFHTGQIMVVLVLGSPILPSKNNFVKALRRNHPDISTVVINVNDKKTSMVLGDRNIVVYGKGYIEDELCGCTFRISPNSFYQVNPKQTELLYEKAIRCAGLTGKERVIDAYCGTGTIGIIASRHAKEVIGVELNKDAIKDAVTNAKRNDVKNIRFFCEDAGKFMVDMAAKKEQADVVIMDPPRTGSTEEFLSSVVKLSPKKVVYVSCGPDTLARDVKFLTKHGYKVTECTPFDCFPMTSHLENICLLEKRNTKA
jgi:23S rRNA (uracil1939-C5)-methyltransferase